MLTLTFLYYGTGLNLRPQYLTQGAHLFSLLSSENTPPPLPRVPVLSLLCHLRRVGLLVFPVFRLTRPRRTWGKKKPQSDATETIPKTISNLLPQATKSTATFDQAGLRARSTLYLQLDGKYLKNVTLKTLKSLPEAPLAVQDFQLSSR